MKNRTPVPRDARPALPAFEAVPRKPRHDGWTPARQVAFIEALADIGSVSRAANQVNMSSESAYALRRAPQAESFGRAWDAAIDMGLLRLKDEAFDRALNGQLVPIIAGGKLVGYRRKKNDRLIMFILRHYTLGANGRHVMTTRMPSQSSPARGGGGSGDQQHAGGMVQPRTRLAEQAGAQLVEGAPQPAQPSMDALPAPEPTPDPLAEFTGVELDDAAQAAILAILEANAARARALEPGDDPDQAFVTPNELGPDHPAAIEPPFLSAPSSGSLTEGDEDWRSLDEPDQRAEIATAVAAIEAKKASGEWDREEKASRAKRKKEDFQSRRMQAFIAAEKQSYEWEDWCREWKG
jgi:hypothetical protein